MSEQWFHLCRDLIVSGGKLLIICMFAYHLGVIRGTVERIEKRLSGGDK